MKQKIIEAWRAVCMWCEDHWLYVVVGVAAACLVAIGAAR